MFLKMNNLILKHTFSVKTSNIYLYMCKNLLKISDFICVAPRLNIYIVLLYKIAVKDFLRIT